MAKHLDNCQECLLNGYVSDCYICELLKKVKKDDKERNNQYSYLQEVS